MNKRIGVFFRIFGGGKAFIASAIISITIGAACWQLFQLIDRLLNQNHLAQQHMEVSNELASFRLQLEQYLNTSFYLTRGLATLIDSGVLKREEVKQWWDANFQTWAAHTTQQLPFIRNIGYADHYTITHSYPVPGNEAVIGVDYRNIAAQWPDVEQLINSKTSSMAGPLQLIQGGTGLVFRTPFFTKKANGEDEYQGLMMMAIDLHELLDAAGLATTQKRLTISLRRMQNSNKPGKVFIGDERLFNHLPSVIQPVNFLGGSWELAAEPLHGWQTHSPHSQRLLLLASLATALVTFATFIILTGLRNHFLQSHILEEKISVRTQQLQQAIIARNAFFATVTHELRTPLNSIIGLGQLISDMELGKQQREYLRQSLTSANMLLSLINDILLYSKIESGKETLHASHFSIAHIVQQLTDLFFVQAQNKGIDFQISTHSELPDIWLGDQGKLLQILTNLCANAIKFTRQGTVLVKFRHEFEKNDNAQTVTYLTVSINDTGIGIAPDDINKLFEPFSQLGSDNQGNDSGTGLGLSICKRLVEIMQGTISVNSHTGTGSTFNIRLPMLIPTEKIHIHSISCTDNPSISLRGKTVLLAEDNATNQIVAKHLLEKIGITVILAVNGQQVLDILQKQAVDAILMDVQMPILNGICTTQAIRKNPAFALLPIIAMTANAGSEDEQQALQAGMNDFVSKPVNIAAFYALLERWIGDL